MQWGAGISHAILRAILGEMACKRSKNDTKIPGKISEHGSKIPSNFCIGPNSIKGTPPQALLGNFGGDEMIPCAASERHVYPALKHWWEPSELRGKHAP